MTFSLRTHQQQAMDVANSPGCGIKFKHVVLSVTPGGGKSMQPVIFGDAMIKRGLADKICWIAPRDNLRTQAEASFTDPRVRQILGHTRTIRTAVNEANPANGHDGYTTTYQAVAADPRLHANEFSKHRYVLILDEAQFVEKDSAFHRAIDPLVKQAALVVQMTGTPSRSVSESEIAYLNYVDQPDGTKTLNLNDTDTSKVIRYSRTDALREKAILPIYFETTDCNANWLSAEGDEFKVESLAGLGDNTRPALDTALRMEAANSIIERTIEHWYNYRKFNPKSKVLVVAKGIVDARRYLKKINSIGYGKFDIATSDMTDEAKRNISRLKDSKSNSSLDGLVTVGMAYVGLDCPQITHIACLTHIRSHEWIEQMLARGTRVDPGAGDYDEQVCYAFAPDDDLFRHATHKIETEQAPFLKTEEEKDFVRKARSEILPPSGGIRPLEAIATNSRAFGIQGEPDVASIDHERLTAVLKSAGLGHIPTPKMKQVFTSLGVDLFGNAGMEPAKDEYVPARGLTKKVPDLEKDMIPSQREAILKKKLSLLTSRFVNSVSIDRRDRSEYQKRIKTLNCEILTRFGSRDNCPEPTLHKMIEYVEEKIREIAR